MIALISLRYKCKFHMANILTFHSSLGTLLSEKLLEHHSSVPWTLFFVAYMFNFKHNWTFLLESVRVTMQKRIFLIHAVTLWLSMVLFINLLVLAPQNRMGGREEKGNSWQLFEHCYLWWIFLKSFGMILFLLDIA